MCDYLACCSIIFIATNGNQQEYATNRNIGWIGTPMSAYLWVYMRSWAHYYQFRKGSAMQYHTLLFLDSYERKP